MGKGRRKRHPASVLALELALLESLRGGGRGLSRFLRAMPSDVPSAPGAHLMITAR
jgi:hypothetical protein